MTARESYRRLCASEPTIPLFSKDWWLDAVCDDAWDVCIVQSADGNVVATMPYQVSRAHGLVLISDPALTQTLGPWIRAVPSKQSTKLAREKELMFALIDQLPSFSAFSQNWHYTVQNWLPFYWRGFEQTTRYTYAIQGLEDLDAVFNNFSSSYRNKIRKADKIVSVHRGLSLEAFYRINSMTFERQGKTIPYSLDFLAKQDDALSKRGAREIFYAQDSGGAIHSALYLVWDDMSSYVHLVGENPQLRSSGAGIRVIWEAIRYTRQELGLNRFDFEGSMIESVEQVRRDCGAVQVPYFSISKTPSRMLRARALVLSILQG